MPVCLVIFMALGLAVFVDAGAAVPALAVPAAAAPDVSTWQSEPLAQEPAARHAGKFVLRYRPHVLDQDLTMALGGLVDDDWRRDHRRFGIGTTLRADRFELQTSLLDDLPGERGARGYVGDRQPGGYGIALGARVSEAPWAWIRATRQWQIPVDGEPVRVSDGLSLDLRPLAPLEIETGTTGDGEQRSWFAQLRFRIELGGG
jgi:hypothetical protein